MLRILSITLLLVPTAYPSADIDYALECRAGFRVSAIRRMKTYYNYAQLGSIAIECEQLANPETVRCDKSSSIPQCSGTLEGCSGSEWLGGYHAYLLENKTQAVILDPICCSSPSVRIDPSSCINDQINAAGEDFSHSIVSDLVYRGMQCWHQYDQNKTLVDLIWKNEVCSFISDSHPHDHSFCEECHCECGIPQCSTGLSPVKITHKRRLPPCGCDCECAYKCLKLQ